MEFLKSRVYCTSFYFLLIPMGFIESYFTYVFRHLTEKSLMIIGRKFEILAIVLAHKYKAAGIHRMSNFQNKNIEFQFANHLYYSFDFESPY